MAFDSFDDDFSTPPSFVPTSKQRQKTGEEQEIPPSFTPSNGNGASGHKPEMIPAVEQTPIHGSYPIFPREPRHSGSDPATRQQKAQALYQEQREQYEQLARQKAELSHHNTYTDNPAPLYAEVSPQHTTPVRTQTPRTTPMNSQKKHTSSTKTSHALPHKTVPIRHHGKNNLPPHKNNKKLNRGGTLAITSHRKKRHHILRGIALFLAFIILALAGTVYGTYAWVDSNIEHYKALTSMPKNDNAETWLITGVDQRDGAAGTGAAGSVPGFRTDSIMLLIAPKKGPDALISIPRDTLVVEDGTHMKINAIAESYGWPALAQKVEELTGVKIDHAVRANFNTIEDVVNAVGGVNVCFDHTIDDPYSGFKWQSGCAVMDGKTALAFTRERHSDKLGDIGREHQQRILIQDVAKEMMKPSFFLNLTKVRNVILAGLKNVKIDNTSHASTLLKMAYIFHKATSKGGITGIPYIADLGYNDPYVGDCILWNSSETKEMSQKILNGTEPSGTVGGIQ